MKKQILTLIIGILIGAIIMAAVFLIIKPKSSVPDFSSNSNYQRMRNNDKKSTTENETEETIKEEKNEE